MLSIPNDPFLRGSGIDGQALVFHSGLVSDARLSNVTIDAIR